VPAGQSELTSNSGRVQRHGCGFLLIQRQYSGAQKDLRCSRERVAPCEVVPAAGARFAVTRPVSSASGWTRGVDLTRQVRHADDRGLIGASGRQVLADLAIAGCAPRAKLADLSQALTGRVHRTSTRRCAGCATGPDRAVHAAVGGLEQNIAARARPVPAGAGPADVDRRVWATRGAAWLAEIGPAPHECFASHERLASWVNLCPGNYMSAGKRSHGRTGNVGTYIKPMLVQAAWAAIKTQGRLQAGTTSWCAGSAARRTRAR